MRWLALEKEKIIASTSTVAKHSSKMLCAHECHMDTGRYQPDRSLKHCRRFWDVLFVLINGSEGTGVKGALSLPALFLLRLGLLDRQRLEARRVTFDSSADLAHIDGSLHNGFSR